MSHSLAWDQVTNADVVSAIQEYDQLGAERFYSEHGFGPTTTHDGCSATSDSQFSRADQPRKGHPCACSGDQATG
jgi:hypothetical protein